MDYTYPHPAITADCVIFGYLYSIGMKHNFKVVERDGKFVIYEGEMEYLTPLCLPLITSDKGLAEAMVRKIVEGKPNLVTRYLMKYNTQELLATVDDLAALEAFKDWDIIHSHEGISLFKDVKLRKLIDAYSESGSISLIYCMGIDNVWENDMFYDPFLDGMMATSGLSSDPYSDYADMKYTILCDQLEEEYEDKISFEFMEGLIRKYNAFLLPSSERARKRQNQILFGD